MASLKSIMEEQKDEAIAKNMQKKFLSDFLPDDIDPILVIEYLELKNKSLPKSKNENITDEVFEDTSKDVFSKAQKEAIERISSGEIVTKHDICLSEAKNLDRLEDNIQSEKLGDISKEISHISSYASNNIQRKFEKYKI
jgi:hypothetical protein